MVKEKGAGAGNGMTMEMWTAKDLLDYETFSKLQARRGKGGRRGGDDQGAKRRGSRRLAAEVHRHHPGRHESDDGSREGGQEIAAGFHVRDSRRVHEVGRAA